MFSGREGTEPGQGQEPAPPAESDARPDPGTPPATFVCPGSAVPISRSVHLSRLRRGFEECRECTHREQVGHLSSPAVRAVANELPTSNWIRGGSLRGVYLNQLTRPVMAGLAEAVASLLWDDLGGLTDDTSKPSPVVVVGRDTRPMAPDLAAGAVAGLRRMGCHVIEVGAVTRPEFWFAVRHLEAFAGVWINGVGTDANGSGLDVVQGTRCWSSPGRLDQLLLRREEGVSRPKNRNGTLATFQTARPYLAGLRKHFHAFRPLTVLFSCRERLVENYLQSLLHESPIQALWDRDLQVDGSSGPEPALGGRLLEQILSQRIDAVLSIEEDGQTCRVWDERGRPVSPLQLVRPLREVIDRRRPARTAKRAVGTREAVRDQVKRQAPDWLQARAAFVRPHVPPMPPSPVSVPLPAVLEREELPPLEVVGAGKSLIVLGAGVLPDGGSLGTDVSTATDTLEAMSQAMAEHESRIGLDGRGAFWFDETGPTSDALITTARVLQLLSQSDHPLSRLWAG